MNNNEMITKIIIIRTVSARIEKAGVVNELDVNLINANSLLDLDSAESIDALSVIDALADDRARYEDMLSEYELDYIDRLF